MGSKLGRALAAAGLVTMLAPSAAFASWWDGGYEPARREQPPPRQPPPSQPPSTQPPPSQPPPTQPPPEQPPSTQPPPSQPAPGQPPPGSPPPAPVPVASIYGCENSDLPGTAPFLHKSTTPPAGTPVLPGQEILVEITWRVSDWTSPDLHKVLDCVYVNNRYAPELSGGERPTPNDGYFAFHYIVPADAPPGTTVCDQGFLSGPNGVEDYGREVSNVVCFTVGSPPPPAAGTTTTTIRPAVLPQRFVQQAPDTVAPRPAPRAAPGPVVLPRDVLPRTGGDTNPARLAAGALALATLARTGAHRRARRPRS